MRSNIFKSFSSAAAKTSGWHVQAISAESSLWIMIRNHHATNRPQGWKLHISAGITSAEAVLDQALGVLLVERAEFKVVASLTRLAELNSGAGGLSQIGKFITVYPNNDQQAVRLALALHEATRGLRGPAIPSDRQLLPGSLIYYRYGSFINRQMQTLAGVILPAISTPDGDLVPDLRTMHYQAFAWVLDPFESVVPTPMIQPRNHLLNSRYLVMTTLYRSAGGAVAQALDITALRRVIIKRAAHDAYLRSDGQDARDMLRHEAAVLARLVPDRRFPTMFELFEQNEDLFLVMEDIAGETLERYLSNLAEQGRTIPISQAIAWGQEVADALATIHVKGFVYCDLKLSNVIVTPENHLCLIDFDLTYDLVAQVLPYGCSTRGYASPQQIAGERPAVSDDVYSFGALLYSMVTGVDPTLAPRPATLLGRPLALLNDCVGSDLVQLIARCLEIDPSKRFPSMLAVKDALAAANIGREVTTLRLEDRLDVASREDASRRYCALALRLGESLCAIMHRLFTEMMSHSPIDDGIQEPVDLYDGSAGRLLVLAELAIAFNNHSYLAAISAEAGWLRTAPRLAKQPLPGLYIGEAGIGAALLRAGQALCDEELIRVASERGRWIGMLPYTSPDLLLGTAGRLRYHLLLWDVTSEREQLYYAIQAGEALLAAAEEVGTEGLRWTIPPNYDDLSGRAYSGFAHGAAGIGDALLDLFEASGDERFLVAAQGGARWLAGMAVDALNDESGLTWPRWEGISSTGACWYDGATGIGKFFLHAAVLRATPDAAEVAARAARTAACGARWAGPSQSHGLSGSIDFLLDMFQVTGNDIYLEQAHNLARLLQAWMKEQEDRLVCLSETPDLLSPGYMNGFGGVALCLLRLSDPKHRLHPLSRGSFSYSPALREIPSGPA